MNERPTHVGGNKGRTVQLQKERKGAITKAKRALFLEHLAQTANVSHSERLANMGQGSSYRLRNADAAFAEAWHAALERGYAHIEAQLLACAMGQPADPARTDAPEARPFDPAMAIRVLTMRQTASHPGRTRGGPKMKRVTIDEVERALRERIDAVAKRLKIDL